MDKNDLLSKQKQFIKFLQEGKTAEKAAQLLQLPLGVIQNYAARR
jgi:hypothetical protein